MSTLSILWLVKFCAGQSHSIVSGAPLKSNPDKEYGWFALPSINGFVMGTAHINGWCGYRTQSASLYSKIEQRGEYDIDKGRSVEAWVGFLFY